MEDVIATLINNKGWDRAKAHKLWHKYGRGMENCGWITRCG